MLIVIMFHMGSYMHCISWENIMVFERIQKCKKESLAAWVSISVRMSVDNSWQPRQDFLHQSPPFACTAVQVEFPFPHMLWHVCMHMHRWAGGQWTYFKEVGGRWAWLYKRRSMSEPWDSSNAGKAVDEADKLSVPQDQKLSCPVQCEFWQHFINILCKWKICLYAEFKRMNLSASL